MLGKTHKDLPKKILRPVGQLLRIIISLITFCLLVPLGFIIPKKKNLLIFIGNYKSSFSGNVKYLYLYVDRYYHSEYEYYFLAEDHVTFEELKAHKLPVIFFPSFKSIIKFYQANAVFVDNNRWITKLRYFYLFNCHKVQLWHGVGFKRIEREFNAPIIKNLLRHCIDTLKGRYPKYDLIISTSKFYTDNVFSKSFNYKKIIECGYPRNDIFFIDPDEKILINTDLKSYKKVVGLHNQGYKIILYAPTFRDLGGDALSDNALDILGLADFARKNKIHFIFKFHPGPEYRFNLEQSKEITLYDNSKDVYPLLSKVDMLITDYSSIYTDYLLLNRPVAFFAYDYEYYVNQNREIQFDYDWITPGPKCYNQTELEREILKVLINGQDDYIQKRKEIMDLAFKYQDGNSSERIWQCVRDFF